MKAAGLFNIKDIRVVDTEKPSLEPGDVLMKVESATTCGTDLKTYLRGYPKLDFPIMPWGHECAGTVAQVGEGCTKFEVGDRITTSNPAPCMKCFYCKRGRPDLCEDNILALGAYAEYFRIPSRLVELNTFKIPDNMSYAQASLIEPISSAIHGFMRADCENLGDAVAVIGAGAQGLSHIQFAKLSGATKIIAIDMVNKRLELAEQLGATHTINGNDTNVEDTVLDLTEGRGCDLVIEAVGTVQTWESAVRMARKAGNGFLSMVDAQKERALPSIPEGFIMMD